MSFGWGDTIEFQTKYKYVSNPKTVRALKEANAEIRELDDLLGQHKKVIQEWREHSEKLEQRLKQTAEQRNQWRERAQMLESEKAELEAENASLDSSRHIIADQRDALLSYAAEVAEKEGIPMTEDDFKEGAKAKLSPEKA